MLFSEVKRRRREKRQARMQGSVLDRLDNFLAQGCVSNPSAEGKKLTNQPSEFNLAVKPMTTHETQSNTRAEQSSSPEEGEVVDEEKEEVEEEIDKVALEDLSFQPRRQKKRKGRKNRRRSGDSLGENGHPFINHDEEGAEEHVCDENCTHDMDGPWTYVKDDADDGLFVPWGKQNYKYWLQRYRLFSLYDEGIRMDKEMWYSVTPEIIAQHLAARCATGVVIDAFCGAGGNSIQLAMTCDHVISIDIDPSKILDAKHNARIYGVDHKIDFIVGDFRTVVPRLKADLIFMSPPWGGPGYVDSDIFDIESMIIPGSEILSIAKKVAPSVVLFMPRNTSFQQLVGLSDRDMRCEIEMNILNGRHKTTTAYYGEVARPSYSAIEMS